jgi:hypothetical protein
MVDPTAEQLIEWLDGDGRYAANNSLFNTDRNNRYRRAIRVLISRPPTPKTVTREQGEEYMHEWLEADAVRYDLPADEIIACLCRDNKELKDLLNRPHTVTREQVDAAVNKFHDFINAQEHVMGHGPDPHKLTKVIRISDIPAFLADLGIVVEEKH